MQHVKAFIAGFLSTLLFHQTVLGLIHLGNPAAPAPFNWVATAPLGVPAVISLAFWGGVWGIVLWLLIRNLEGAKHWILATVIGALGPSAVALFVVMPLKGMGMAAGWDPKIIVGALILNGAWGIGVALLMRLMQHESSF
jgi:hypothetical protein